MKNTVFDAKRIAEGYKNRPYLHSLVIKHFQNTVGREGFRCGLDIGCGAGLSTKALADICDHVTGIDISKEMILVAKEVCENNRNIDFEVSVAEDYLKSGNRYDVVTAAGAIQWINRDSLLTNLDKMMTDKGYLVIYDFAISDEMIGVEEYSQWWHQLYLKEFPRPYRDETVWTDDMVKLYGFTMVNQISSRMEYKFRMDEFISFMMIQSNVNTQIQNGKKENEIRKWFEATLADIFKEEEKTLIFKGYNWYIQKTSDN